MGTDIHALVFNEPHEAVEAVTTLRSRGFEIEDVHSPFPIHGIDEALGFKETNLPWATLVGGFVGGGLAMWFQIYTHTMDWPHNIGGKTDLALPALIPVSFELTVLFAAFFTLFALLIRQRLKPSFRSGTPKKQPIPRVTDDAFVVLVRNSDPEEHQRLKALWSALEPAEVIEKWGSV